MSNNQFEADGEQGSVPTEREYARPNQNWICGKASVGCSCPIGPSTTGACRATYDCEPAKIDDSWKCTRTNSQGGRCENGPFPDGACCHKIKPCVPVRSLHSRRFQVSIGVFAFAVGIAAIILAFPSSSEIIAPGNLTYKHAATANSCADCHNVDDSGLNQWVDNALNIAGTTVQSQKCLKCHEEIGPNALDPHSRSPDLMNQLTEAMMSRSMDESGSGSGSIDFIAASAKSLFGSGHLHGNLECAACHKEHQGVGHDLKVLSNQQCQVCHASSFASFEHGHPELTKYPFRRRTKIYFDHGSHYGKHFADKMAAANGASDDISCNLCHVADPTGVKMELRGFEQTCSKCHAEQITEDLIPGFEIAGIPGLDTETMFQRGFSPGLWPESDQVHAAAKGEIPALMKLMLMSDSRFDQIRKPLESLNLSDLRNASDDELKSATELAWLIKESLQTWSSGRQMSDSPIEKLIPTSQFKELQAKWFPSLSTELKARAQKEEFEWVEPASTKELSEVAEEQNRYARSINQGWYLQDSDLTLRYRPTGHADPVFKQLVEFVTELENSSKSAGQTNTRDSDAQLVSELFDSVSSPFAPGRCAKCHTIDRSIGKSEIANGSGNYKTIVNWLGVRAEENPKRFTHFRHGPHLNTMSNDECASCHSLDSSPIAGKIFGSNFIKSSGQLSFDSSKFRCDFSMIGKQNCSSCHNQKSVGSNCLDCHNYHVR